MRTIRIKLIAMYLAMVFIVMVVSGTILLSLNRNQNRGKVREELKAYADKIEEQVLQVSSTPEQFEKIFERLYFSSYYLTRLQGYILNSKGQTIYSTTKTKQAYSNAVVISALAGKEGFNPGRRDTDPATGLVQEWIEYAIPVSVSNGTGETTMYIIYVRADATPIRTSMGEMANSLVLTLVVALILAGVIGSLFASTLTGPIRMLTKISKAMARGDLKQEIPVKSDDEIGQLTQSFNDMAQELNISMANMTSEKNKMEALLHNMTDGVLAYDVGGALIHANYICWELLDFNDVEALDFSQMMERLEIDLNSAAELEPGLVKEYTLTMGDRFISAIFTTYSNPFGFMEGVVIVLRDVTKLKKLDNMRKEFVANVSHELRTPLTTIKSYAETLLFGALENKETAVEFLEVIDAETDRMTLLVRDLLELSRYDNRQLNLEMAWADIVELVRQNIRQNQLLAEGKNQTILFRLEQEQLLLWIDPPRVNQVLTNVLTNAMKYSYEGGVIEITLENSAEECRIIVKDNGMGIPREDLDHIFERFYRVDKARSRAMGGTGLGLAIVKEIMDAHGGRVQVESRLDKGTTMILSFSKQGAGHSEYDPEGSYSELLAHAIGEEGSLEC